MLLFALRDKSMVNESFTSDVDVTLFVCLNGTIWQLVPERFVLGTLHKMALSVACSVLTVNCIMFINGVISISAPFSVSIVHCYLEKVM